MHRTLVVIAVIAVALTGCGGNTPKQAAQSPTPTPTSTTKSPNPLATCSPSGTALNLTASGISYNVSCLAAPKGKAFTIVFDNQDPGIQHSVVIFDKDPHEDSTAKQVFHGERVTGAKKMTYQVPALAAAIYHFHCEVHPLAMSGVLVVA